VGKSFNVASAWGARHNHHIPHTTNHPPFSATQCAFCAGGLKALTPFRSLCYGQMVALAVIFLVDTKEALRVWAEATLSFYV
jgi:hypothetical protein